MRGSPRDEVVRVADAVATARGIRCLVGPEVRGWVGVYPANGGQDPGVGEALAAALPGAVVQLLLHDESVVAYWLWSGGTQLDSFFSRPGALGDRERAKEDSMVGRAEAFEEVLPGSARKLQRWLKRGEGRDEHGRFEGIASALKIANATTSYEYLKGGETKGVRGWKKFVEVPRAAMTEEQRADDAVGEARLAARRDGRLLADLTLQNVRSVQAAGGWVVSGSSARRKARMLCFAPPWGKPVSPATVPVQDGHPQLDASAARIVMKDSTGLLYEVDRKLWMLPHPRERTELGSDKKLVVHRDYELPTVPWLTLDRRALPETLADAQPHRAAFHPSGRWAVAWVQTDVPGVEQLAVAAMDTTERKDLALDPLGPHPGDAALKEHVKRARAIVALDLDTAVEAFKRNTPAGASPTEDDVTRYRAQLQSMQASMQRWLLAWGKGLDRVRESGGRISFTRDGQWMFFASNRGLRVYAWPEVAAATGTLPRYRHWFDTTGIDERGLDTGHIQATVEDPVRGAIVFGGTQGILYRMALDSGRVVRLGGTHAFRIPHWITCLELSPDGEALLVERRPSMLHGGSQLTRVWQLWRYSRLTEEPLP